MSPKSNLLSRSNFFASDMASHLVTFKSVMLVCLRISAIISLVSVAVVLNTFTRNLAFFGSLLRSLTHLPSRTSIV